MPNSFRKLKLRELNRVSLEAYKKDRKIPLIVLLDNIRSLHNIGAIFRTSDAFLVQEIWLIGITAQPPHREIQKTALGATESVSWSYFNNVEEVLQKIEENNIRLICVEQSTNSRHPDEIQIEANQTYALALGNEVDGTSDEFMNHTEQVMEIPQFGTKHSLNVSIAAGIAIWELYKVLKG